MVISKSAQSSSTSAESPVGIASHSNVPLCNTSNVNQASLFTEARKQEGKTPDEVVVFMSITVVPSQTGIAVEHKLPPEGGACSEVTHNSKVPSLPEFDITPTQTC